MSGASPVTARPRELFEPLYPRLLHFGVPWPDLDRAAEGRDFEQFGGTLATAADR